MEKESSAFALVTGLLLISVMVPFTFGSTNIVCPVIFATTLATDSISALLNERVTVADSAGELFCADTIGINAI